jgi:DNA-binding transcriptional MerR regulator
VSGEIVKGYRRYDREVVRRLDVCVCVMCEVGIKPNKIRRIFRGCEKLAI